MDGWIEICLVMSEVCSQLDSGQYLQDPLRAPLCCSRPQPEHAGQRDSPCKAMLPVVQVSNRMLKSASQAAQVSRWIENKLKVRARPSFRRMRALGMRAFSGGKAYGCRCLPLSTAQVH